jgi:hypothetical protein
MVNPKMVYQNLRGVKPFRNVYITFLNPLIYQVSDEIRGFIMSKIIEDQMIDQFHIRSQDSSRRRKRSMIILQVSRTKKNRFRSTNSDESHSHCDEFDRCRRLKPLERRTRHLIEVASGEVTHPAATLLSSGHQWQEYLIVEEMTHTLSM